MSAWRESLVALVAGGLGIVGGLVAQDYRSKFASPIEYQQLISENEAFSVPAELKVKLGEPTLLKAESICPLVQFVPLQKEIKMTPYNGRSRFFSLDSRAKLKDEHGNALVYQVESYTAHAGMPTNFKLTNLVVEDSELKEEVKK